MRGIRSGAVPATWLSWCTVLLAACTPDLPFDPTVPEMMQFDPAAVPARVPEPISLVLDPATGLIDMALAGVDVPDDCAAATLAMSVAQCEFYQYLESLDGFPTLAGARAPVTTDLDPATLTPSTVAVMDVTRRAAVDDVARGFDPEGDWLTIDPVTGWEPGTLYAAVVRGYERGVRTEGGLDLLAPPLMVLLKEPGSLTCGAPDAAGIPATCGYLALLAQDQPDPEARASLVTLEAARVELEASGAWQAAADPGGIPREEAALLWTFPTHSAPVVELDPSRGMVPVVTSPREVYVTAKGDLAPASVTPSTLATLGSTFLLDLTALSATPPDLVHGLPRYAVTATADSDARGRAGGPRTRLVFVAEADLIEGHVYGLLLTGGAQGVRDVGGRALVASPVTVLLRSSGALVDLAGHSQVEGVTDADASELEEGRRQLADLYALFSQVTGLQREDLAYVYAFTFSTP